MKSSEQRKRLHTYVADLDDKKVVAMLTLLEDETTYKTQPSLTDLDKKEIRLREKNRISGRSKTYTINQSKKSIRHQQK